jgi:hypothetical protein
MEDDIMTSTPAPWRKDKHYPDDGPPQIVIVAKQGDIVATIIPGPNAAEADANLIIAAPVLLEALKAIQPNFDLLPSRVRAIALAAIQQATREETA